jgi:hypothetical protein
MSSQLLALKDVGNKSGAPEYLDQSTGKVYSDPGGRSLVRDMVPTDYILGEKGQVLKDDRGHVMHVSALSNAAAVHYYQNVVDLTRKPMRIQLRGESGQLFAMDLAVSDVHTAAALPNYAAGYRIADGVADIASPAILVPKQSDVYYTWDSGADFKRKLPNGAAPGSGVAEVNPTLTPATYTTIEYAMGGFLPTEVQSNADVPLKPFQKLTQVVVDALRLEREYRVATLLETSGSWNSGVVTTIAAGAQWNGGATSDPIANLHHQIEQSYLPVTGIVWSELVEHDFLRNPAVQKYFTFKDMIDGLPSPQKLSSTLRLPPIYTATMKYFTAGALSYVWGNHVVLLHQPKQQPPTDQMDVASSYTMRWTGGPTPDGSVTAGLLVRTYYDPKRGARGGTQVVAVVNDTEVMTSALVGGLLINAHQ